jgi:hypothetical protein
MHCDFTKLQYVGKTLAQQHPNDPSRISSAETNPPDQDLQLFRPKYSANQEIPEYGSNFQGSLQANFVPGDVQPRTAIFRRRESHSKSWAKS